MAQEKVADGGLAQKAEVEGEDGRAVVLWMHKEQKW